MIDISLEGLDLIGVLVEGKVELIKGEEAQLINHKIHPNSIISEAFTDPVFATYLSSGDDMTIEIYIDKLVSWNLANCMAGVAIIK